MFLFKKKPNNQPQVQRVDWRPVVRAVMQRVRGFDGLEISMLGFRIPGSSAQFGDFPTLLFGRVPKTLNAEDPNCYSISYQGDEPSEYSKEDAFLAWSSRGFLPFEDHNRHSYLLGCMSLEGFETKFSEALEVLSDVYGVGPGSKVQTIGDQVLNQFLSESRSLSQRGLFSFEISTLKKHQALSSGFREDEPNR